MASLFRDAALEASRSSWLGEIVLIRPLSFLVLTALATGLALLTLCFLLLASYTQRSTVAGQLVPDRGVIKVYAPQGGIVVEKHVREGQQVQKGDVLYLTSSERQSGAAQAIQEEISRKVALRSQSLRKEQEQRVNLHADEEAALKAKIASLDAEHANIVGQLGGQRRRVGLAEAALRRAAQLKSKGFISIEMVQQREADLLDQRSRVQMLERDKLATGRELQALRSELASLPVRQQGRDAQLERLITSTEQEWMESEGKRRIAITAPESGTVTAVSSEAGQAVEGGRPLVAVIPAGGLLQAHLYAPSRAVGFIRQGDPVQLRYQAFPYQKFGHAQGVVASISRIAVGPNEIANVGGSPNGEPLFKLTVALEKQHVVAYGQQQPLQAGMQVEADILHERRKLYEWVLEPLYSLTGKL
jgi:membrane fusion protein